MSDDEAPTRGCQVSGLKRVRKDSGEYDWDSRTCCLRRKHSGPHEDAVYGRWEFGVMDLDEDGDAS